MISSQPQNIEQLAGETAATLLKEHKTTGAHKDTTHDSVTVNERFVLTSGTPDTLAATVVNYTPYASSVEITAPVLRLKASTAISIRGFKPVTNAVRRLRNIGSNNITLEHEDTAAFADWRFQLPNSTDVVLGQYDGVTLYYDDLSKRWTCFQQ